MQFGLEGVDPVTSSDGLQSPLSQSESIVPLQLSSLPLPQTSACDGLTVGSPSSQGLVLLLYWQPWAGSQVSSVHGLLSLHAVTGSMVEPLHCAHVPVPPAPQPVTVLPVDPDALRDALDPRAE